MAALSSGNRAWSAGAGARGSGHQHGDRKQNQDKLEAVVHTIFMGISPYWS
jgi:hypothetical protein